MFLPYYNEFQQLLAGPQVLDECPICQEALTKDWFRTSCGHIFCVTCARTWFRNKSSCPNCRTELYDEDTIPYGLRDFSGSDDDGYVSDDRSSDGGEISDDEMSNVATSDEDLSDEDDSTDYEDSTSDGDRKSDVSTSVSEDSMDSDDSMLDSDTEDDPSSSEDSSSSDENMESDTSEDAESSDEDESSVDLEDRKFEDWPTSYFYDTESDDELASGGVSISHAPLTSSTSDRGTGS